MSESTTHYQFDRAQSGHSGPVMPERRDLHFLPPGDRICDWHVAGPNVTQFMNALSLLFPAGERMFIDAARSYRDEIPDPDLKKSATAFIGQEAMHSREHVEYNKLMANAGLPAHKLDKFTPDLLAVLKHNTPKSTPLAATIAQGPVAVSYERCVGVRKSCSARREPPTVACHDQGSQRRRARFAAQPEGPRAVLRQSSVVALSRRTTTPRSLRLVLPQNSAWRRLARNGIRPLSTTPH